MICSLELAFLLFESDELSAAPVLLPFLIVAIESEFDVTSSDNAEALID